MLLLYHLLLIGNSLILTCTIFTLAAHEVATRRSEKRQQTMSEKSVQLNEGGSVEGTLNELLEAEAQKLTQAVQYEHNEQRQGYRSDHCNRNLTTTSGDITLKVPKLKGIPLRRLLLSGTAVRRAKKPPVRKPKP